MSDGTIDRGHDGSAELPPPNADEAVAAAPPGTAASEGDPLATAAAPDPADAVDAPPPLVLPPVQHPSSPTYVTPTGYGAMPAAPPSAPGRAALLWFLGGVAVAVGVSIAGWIVVNSRGGGVLWWGGYFVTLALWRTAWRNYQIARGATGQKLGGAALAVVVVGALLAVGSAALFASAYIGEKTAPPIADGVGSCWADKGDQVVNVSCSDSTAAYVAVSEAASDADCPSTIAGSIDSTTPGKVLCLNRR